MPGEVPPAGDRQQIEVLRASVPDTLVTVSGKPGQVAARTGDVRRRGAPRQRINRVWMTRGSREAASVAAVGIAECRRPHAPSSNLRPAAPLADPMIVTWKDRIVFDSRTAHFERSVERNATGSTKPTCLTSRSTPDRLRSAPMEEQVQIDHMDSSRNKSKPARSIPRP